MKSVKVIDEDNSASIMVAPVAVEEENMMKEEEIKVEPAAHVKSSADKNVLNEVNEVQIDKVEDLS